MIFYFGVPFLNLRYGKKRKKLIMNDLNLIIEEMKTNPKSCNLEDYVFTVMDSKVWIAQGFWCYCWRGDGHYKNDYPFSLTEKIKFHFAFRKWKKNNG